MPLSLQLSMARMSAGGAPSPVTTSSVRSPGRLSSLASRPTAAAELEPLRQLQFLSSVLPVDNAKQLALADAPGSGSEASTESEDEVRFRHTAML